jgi:hypothetical protein
MTVNVNPHPGAFRSDPTEEYESYCSIREEERVCRTFNSGAYRCTHLKS